MHPQDSFTKWELESLAACTSMLWSSVLENIGCKDEYDFKIPVPHNVVIDSVLKTNSTSSFKVYTAKNAKYNHGQFASQRIKYSNPRSSDLRYNRGDSISVGCKTPTDPLYILFSTMGTLYKSDVYFLIPPKPNNMVFASELPYSVDLAELVVNNATNCSYEPKDFSGACYKPDVNNNRQKGNIFEDGAFTLLGVDSVKKAILLAKHIHALTSIYRKTERWNRQNKVEERDAELTLAKRRAEALLLEKLAKIKDQRLKEFLLRQNEDLEIAY